MLSHRLFSFLLPLFLAPLTAMSQTEDTESGGGPLFDRPHGLCEEEFTLAMTPSVPGRVIHYTYGGDEPTWTSTVYSRPITVRKTTVVRAVEEVTPDSLSAITTASYLFPEAVLTQGCDANGNPTAPSGYPTTWGKFDTMSGTAPAYYAMDSRITAESRQEVLDGLHQLPIVSLVTERNHLFNKVKDAEKGGLYIFTGSPMGDGTGRDWERPVSFELIGGELQHDVTVDCGLKLHGGHSRLPEKNPKHAFKLLFKSKYGPKKLHHEVFGPEGVEKYEDLVLRTFFGNAWQHWDEGNRTKAQYTRDLWARSIQERLGYPHSKGQTVNLFINGMYWGIYNLCERINAEHCATHYGGKEKYYDVIKVEETQGEAVVASDGTLDAWTEMKQVAQQVKSSSNKMLYRLEGRDEEGHRDPELAPLLDLDAFCDYMLINFYGGNTDWDHHNWYAFRYNDQPDHGFRFFCWDTECIFINVNEDVTGKNNTGKPTQILNYLMRNGQFKKRFNHRAHVLLTDGGLLTPDGAIAVWDSLYHLIDHALYAESARWGAYRRDIHPYQSKGHLYRVDSYYMDERNRLLTQYFPKRTGIVINQLKSRGWYTTNDDWADLHGIEQEPASLASPIYDLHGRLCGHTDTDGSLPASLPAGHYIVKGKVQWVEK